MKALQVLIADDHEALCEGVRRIVDGEPDMEVCGTVRSGRDAVAQAETLRPDVVLLDIGMPELNGLDAARQIRRLLPQTEVLIFTAHEKDELIKEAFEAGAKSYILKSEETPHLLEAVRSLGQHKPFFTNRISQIIFARFFAQSDPPGLNHKPSSRDDRLSRREREVVQLLAEGKTNKDVATTLGISVRTAETHRAGIMQKLGVHSLAGLVRYAIRNHIIEA